MYMFYLFSIYDLFVQAKMIQCNFDMRFHQHCMASDQLSWKILINVFEVQLAVLPKLSIIVFQFL